MGKDPLLKLDPLCSIGSYFARLRVKGKPTVRSLKTKVLTAAQLWHADRWKLLAKLEDVRVDPTRDRRIIMVCDQAYDNVPQRIFGRAPMAHAVAYSTGETGLIAPEEFARLDVSRFVDLQILSKTNMIQDGSADGSAPFRSETNGPSSAAGGGR